MSSAFKYTVRDKNGKVVGMAVNNEGAKRIANKTPRQTEIKTNRCSVNPFKEQTWR